MADNGAEIIGGPAKVNLGGTNLDHTQGGITTTITPATRQVTVDHFGSSPVLIRATGDDVKVTTPLAQWNAATLGACLETGHDDTAGTPPSLGLGRSAGYIYTSAALKIIPILAADAGKLIHLFKATATGSIELGHNNENDVIAEVEWTALVDETKSQDGAYMGLVYVSGGT